MAGASSLRTRSYFSDYSHTGRSMIRGLIIEKTRREGVLYRCALEASTLFSQLRNLNNVVFRRVRIRQYYQSHKVIRIQFGSGDSLLDGFLNTDLLGHVPVDITRPLPFPADSVDVFYSNHLIEHIYNRQLLGFLRHTLNALRPGGIHIVGTPSLEKLVKILYGPDERKKNILLRSHESSMGEQLDPATFLNRMAHINYGHRFLYDEQAINRLAKKAGYASVETINNLDVPDEAVRSAIRQKDECWDIETETFVLTKAA
jgi:predicted SAM-dependent methyltransferase